MLRVCTALVVSCLLLLCWERSLSLEAHRDRGVLPIDPPTPFYRFLPEGTPLGRVLVIHGLNASKEFMQVFCSALADAGFEVYAIDLPGHGDSRVGFSATRAGEAVSRTLDHLTPVHSVVGHSLGGGILLDLANDRELPRTILLSPAPTPLDHADVSRSLVVTGEWDIPAVRVFAARLEGAEWWDLPWTAHSSALFNARQTRDMVRWLGGKAERTRTGDRVFWNAAVLIASLMLIAALLPPKRWEGPARTLGLPDACGWFVLAGTASALVHQFVVPLQPLRLFATDYLLSMFFLTGVCLIVGAGYGRDRPALHLRPPAMGRAILAAAYVIVGVGFLGGSRFMHFPLSDGRWWRFLLIAFTSFPLFLFDEIAVRTRLAWRTAALGVLTRSAVGAAILAGASLLNGETGFLLLIIHLVVLFWIALWCLTDVVRRHTQDPIAAALFASLVQGWMLAAWFVTT